MFQYHYLLDHRRVLKLNNCCYVCAFLGEPNNYQYINPGGEDCLTLRYPFNELNDVHCTFESMGYVCEKDGKNEDSQ